MISGILVLSWLICAALGNENCNCTYDKRKSCHCTGAYFKIPSILPSDVNALQLSHGKLRGLVASALNEYRDSLQELTINYMENFTYVDNGALENLTQLHYLSITHTDLKEVPRLELKGLTRFNSMHVHFSKSFNSLGWNRITKVQARNIKTVELFLGFNEIEDVPALAFNGSEILKLSLRGNYDLSELSFAAFSGIEGLKELDLSDTSIAYLPSAGLEQLEVLIMNNTAALRSVPSLYEVKSLQKVWMSVAAHCCAFMLPCDQNSNENEAAETLRVTQTFESYSIEVDTQITERRFFLKEQLPASKLPTLDSSKKEEEHTVRRDGRKPIDCWPQPDALNPCEDMITWKWLKGSIWVVLLVALGANILVLIVVAASRTEKPVARILIVNLAFADMSMAVYLFLLATMDAVSTTAYYKYASIWQQGTGCKVAGFLTIFSCQLSLFTLSLLTLERWFSIKRALYANLLDIKITSALMIVGWFYSLSMAALPLLGVSSYNSNSVCLPMDIRDYRSFVYVILLVCSGGVNFLLMCVCYTQIYLSLRKETRRHRGKSSIAKKMIVLVGTNFICWVPIAFFALTALAGQPLITMAQSKILLVFVYPFNSCANPFLYVITTRQFKRDVILLLARYKLCNHFTKRYNFVNARPMSHDTQHITSTILTTKSFVI